MTLVNVTIAEDSSFAVISADTYVSPGGAIGSAAGITADAGEALASIRERATGAPVVEPLGEVEKIVVHPDFKLALTGMGSLALGLWWQRAPVTHRGIDQLLESAPAYLREGAAQLPDMDFTALAVGWSQAKGRVIATAFEAPDFAPVEIGPGHTFHPYPDDEGPEYAPVYHGWKRALTADTEAWHRFLVDKT